MIELLIASIVETTQYQNSIELAKEQITIVEIKCKKLNKLTLDFNYLKTLTKKTYCKNFNKLSVEYLEELNNTTNDKNFIDLYYNFNKLYINTIKLIEK